MKIFIRFLAISLTASLVLVTLSCEDDAILEPTKGDECTGSYCSLALPGSKAYAQIQKNNPRTF